MKSIYVLFWRVMENYLGVFSSMNSFNGHKIGQCVQNCTYIPGNKGIVYMFETNCSSLHQQFKIIVACYNKEKGKF